MSGVFSRKLYDECFAPEFVRQQVGPMEYALDGVYAERPDKCFAGKSRKPSKHGELPAGPLPQLREIESFLRNIDIPSTRCMPAHTLAAKDARIGQYLAANPLSAPHMCAEGDDAMHSRLVLPVADFRSAAWPAQGYPLINWQSAVFYGFDGSEQVGNSRFGTNTRLQMKDLHARAKK